MTTATALRVEIGPPVDGTRLGKDWTTVGVQNVDHHCIWGIHDLPFDDDSVDEVYASHVIEHIPWWRAPEAVADVFRVLRSGGFVEIHTIDFRAVVDHYMFGSCGDWSDRRDIGGDDPMFWVASRIFSRGESYGDPQWHKSLYDRPYLTRVLERAGFEQIEDAGTPRGKEKHGVANLGVKAVKP